MISTNIYFCGKKIKSEIKTVRKHLRLTKVASSSLVTSIGTVAVKAVPGL